MEKTYLCLYPDTFLWNKNMEGLIYNSKNGHGFRFKNEALKGVTEMLSISENLYCIEITNLVTGSTEMQQFIGNIQKYKLGEFVNLSADNPKPVILPPLLNLQSDIERLRKESPEMVGENVLNYLHELTIYLNTFPNKPEVFENINSNMLNNFLDSILYSSLAHIHIKGANILTFPGLTALQNILDRMHVKKSIYITLDDFRHEYLFKGIFPHEQFVLVLEAVNFDDSLKMDEVIKIIKEKNIPAEWKFQIRNEEEYQTVESLIEKYQLTDAEIKPVFTEDNLQFFEDNIYLTEEDLQNPGLNRREVFAHQSLNTNDFGKLTIIPDGKVYANPYFPALGTIEDDIRELIYTELTEGQSWLRIRDMKPCCDCVYQWLCPPPSNYELVIGKPNLCKIMP